MDNFFHARPMKNRQTKDLLNQILYRKDFIAYVRRDEADGRSFWCSLTIMCFFNYFWSKSEIARESFLPIQPALQIRIGQTQTIRLLTRYNGTQARRSLLDMNDCERKVIETLPRGRISRSALERHKLHVQNKIMMIYKSTNPSHQHQSFVTWPSAPLQIPFVSASSAVVISSPAAKHGQIARSFQNKKEKEVSRMNIWNDKSSSPAMYTEGQPES